MAAPSGTVWGAIKGSYGRIGIYVGLSSTATATTATIQVWFWSKYSVSDSNNRFWYNHNATTATTEKTGDITIRHTVSSGSGWSTSNQTKLGTFTYTYSRTTSAQKKSCAAKFSGIDSVASGSAMTVTASFTVPALPTYAISYNANGGSGAPSSQTKIHGTAITLSTAVPTRTGYSFLGWSTSSTSTTVSYAAGASYTTNAAATLYAVWKADTYAVTYDANGGSGAPSSQTKTYGVNLTLSSTIPTKTNYNFLGWGLSPSATTVSYAAGASYTSNSAITLYAIWELAYVDPRISSLSVIRCDSSGASADDGTYFKMAFSWATDKEVTSITVEWKTTSATSWTSSMIVATGTSGSVSQVFGDGAITTESAHNIRVTVADEIGSTTASKIIPGLAYAIDFKAGGKGVAIGKPAQKDNVFEVALTQYDKFETLVGNGLAAYTGSGDKGIDPDTTLESLILTNVNTPGSGGFMYITTMFYSTKSATANRIQVAMPYSTSGDMYRRYYYDGSWSEWCNTALAAYPVNSIYMSYSHTSPAELFGGTWARISPYFLYATGEDGVIGETGGEAEHILTIDEMPKHQHRPANYNVAGSTSGYARMFTTNLNDSTTSVGRRQVATSSSSGIYTYTATTSGDIDECWATESIGGGAGHANIPPFIKVSVWRRVE